MHFTEHEVFWECRAAAPSFRSETYSRGSPLRIDGFNLILTLESAVGGGVVLGGRDGCYRDMASVHGTYRRVEETRSALAAVRARAGGISAAQALTSMSADSDAEKTSVRNALAALKRSGQVDLKDGKYTAKA